MAHDAGHTAFEVLCDVVGSGRFAWGEPLVITELAAELKLSPTPVREAMARLAGEGLIDHRPGRGYMAPSLTGQDVTDLYAFHEILCAQAMLRLNGEFVRLEDDQGEETVFADLIARAGNRFMSQAMARTTRQLRPVRAVELDLPGIQPLLALPVASTAQAVSASPLAAALAEYHRQRFSNAEAIARRLRWPLQV